MPTFTPPTRVEYFGGLHPLWRRMSLLVGTTVLNEGGFYRQVEEPTDEEVAGADAAYLGGRSYTVTQDEADDLTAAGYGEWVT